MDLPNFPETHPKNWVAQQCNTVHIELMMIDVRQVTLEGVSTDSVIDIEIATVDVETGSGYLFLVSWPLTDPLRATHKRVG